MNSQSTRVIGCADDNAWLEAEVKRMRQNQMAPAVPATLETRRFFSSLMTVAGLISRTLAASRIPLPLTAISMIRLLTFGKYALLRVVYIAGFTI